MTPYFCRHSNGRGPASGVGANLAGRTSILITHRIAPLKRPIGIIVMDEGRIVEMGDHPTLLAMGGIYADLYWQRQLEERDGARMNSCQMPKFK